MDLVLHRFGHEAMNTVFEVIIDGEDATYARSAADIVFREIDRLESLLSRFDPGSDISQINRLQPGTSVRVGLEVFECLQLAAKVHAATGGAFDVTVGSLMNCVRNPRSTPAERASARQRVGMRQLVFGVEELSIGVREPVEVDLGAIGKGYALDQAAKILAEWGIKRALLNAGTSTVLALGDDWPVGIGGDWGKAAGMEKIALSNQALSGSGTEVQGQHILDPRTGVAARKHLAAWAVAPSGALSDALSTAFMVMTTDAVRRLCAAEAAVGALVVEPRRGVLRLLKEKLVVTRGVLDKIVVTT